MDSRVVKEEESRFEKRSEWLWHGSHIIVAEAEWEGVGYTGESRISQTTYSNHRCRGGSAY